MTRVYLIRHGEAEGNIKRIAQGHQNGAITAKGWQQIAALQERFAAVPIDAVYASDLQRTRDTASALYVPKGLALHTDPAFREISLGRWEGRPWSELYAHEAEKMDDFNHHTERWQVEGSETAQQVLARFLPALYDVAASHDGGTIAVVSHGCALRIVLTVLQGLPMESIGASAHSDNTAVSLLEVEGRQTKVLYRDDNSHLLAKGLSTLATQDWWKE